VSNGSSEFLQLSPLHDIVHGVENNANQQIHDSENNSERDIVLPYIGPISPSMTDHITQDKGALEDQNIPQDEINVL
jgi:hypothetical protein